MIKRFIRKISFIRGYTRSLVMGWINRKKYHGIRSFVLFIGYPRSGHSLIAALLDAHPNVVISLEWGALSHLRLGYGKLQLFSAIERHARLFTSKLQNRWTGYSYRVENQWQGKSDDIRVIGDKLAGRTSLILLEYPQLLDMLRKEVRVELKLIHVIRNPFDTISTMARHALEKSGNSHGDPDLYGFTEKYFKRVQLVSSLKASEGISMFDLYHEDFIERPAGSLADLLGYLGISPDPGFLEQCAGIVFKSPHKSRYRYKWPENLVDKVHSHIESCDFLRRYSFNE